MSDVDFTESSLDGSLYESFASEAPEPAINVPASPDFDTTLPRNRQTHSAVKTLQLGAMDSSLDQIDREHCMNQSAVTDERSRSNILDHLGMVDSIPHCNKISSMLREAGYANVQILNSDIDPSTSSVSTFVVDSWAESVLAALAELQDRAQSHRQTLSAVTSNALRTEAGQDHLLAKMQDLQNKLNANEQRERAALMKIKMLEESTEKKSKTSGSEAAELKRQMKNMENQHQELERRCRTKDLEIERLKQKLAHIAEKERETNARNRHIVSQIKAGDLTFVGDKALLASPPPSPEADSSMLSGKNSTTARGGNSASAGANASFHSAVNRTTSSVGSKTTGSRAAPGAPGSPNAHFVTATTVVSLTAVVEALESQRKELFARNKELELQVRDLLQSLRKAQNGANAGEERRGMNDRRGANEDHRREASPEPPGRMNPTAQSMYQRILKQEAEIEALRRQVETNQAILAERDEIIAGQRQRGQELHDEIENLRVQLDARPTMRQWTQAQRDRDQLEEKLHDLILLRGEAAEISMWRKHLSTADRIKVDKRNHELGLWLLDSLPKATMKEVLQTVCRELDISEISEIQPSLVKLKAVVKTVPRMERFISQVCGFVFQRHPSLGEVDGMKSVGGSAEPSSRGADGQPVYTMEHMLPILRRWWYAAQRCVELEGFHSRVLLELYRRQEVLARKTELATGAFPRNPGTVRNSTEMTSLTQQWEAQGKYQWACKDPERIFEMVRDLVDFQVEVMHHDQSLIYAEDYIRDRPEILVNRIVGHIQYLFEIKTLDGVLPRMNQIYLFVEEMRTFLAAVRAMVQSKSEFANSPAVTNSMLLAEVQRRLALYSSQSNLTGGLK